MGIDSICGMGDNSIISHDLVTELHRKNLFVLKDIQRDSGLKYWADTSELGLTRSFAEEWDRYISSPNHGNVTLTESTDKLV